MEYMKYAGTSSKNQLVKRLFIAIPPPPNLVKRIKRLQDILAPHYERWRPTVNPHLTLRFIGNTPVESISAIDKALQTIESVEVPIKFEGLGIFKKQNNLTIWASMEKNPLLMHLQNAIDKALFLHAHIPLDLKPYFPHITLGRAKKIEPHPQPETIISPTLLKQYSFMGKEFILFSSVLSNSGASHFTEHVYPFSPYNLPL